MASIRDLLTGVINNRDKNQFGTKVDYMDIEPMYPRDARIPYQPHYDAQIQYLKDKYPNYVESIDGKFPSFEDSFDDTRFWGKWGYPTERGMGGLNAWNKAHTPEGELITSPTQISAYDVSPQGVYGQDNLSEMKAFFDKYHKKHAPEGTPEWEQQFYDPYGYEYQNQPYHENVFAAMNLAKQKRGEAEYSSRPKSVLQGLLDKTKGLFFK